MPRRHRRKDLSSAGVALIGGGGTDAKEGYANAAVNGVEFISNKQNQTITKPFIYFNTVSG